MEFEQLKQLFENWVKAQFKNGQELLSNSSFSEEDGYEDDTLNSMWVGFCAGYFLAE